MCQFVQAGSWVLPPEPSSVRRARLLCRDHRCPRRDEGQAETALLLVSELVSNAVEHGAPPIEISLACDDRHVLRVRVSDAGPAWPTPRAAAVDDELGRGLAITALLSDGWGIDPVGDGKAVWFRLVPERPPAGENHATRKH